MDSYHDVKPGDGFERWHHVTCRNYSLTECRPIPDRCFSASVAVRPFGRLAISQISSRVRDGGQLAVARGTAEIRRDGRDDFFIWIGRGGTTHLEQEGRGATLGAGDLMLMDQARPFELSFGPTSATTMVIVPRELLEARLRNAGHLVAQRIDGRSATARLAVALTRECAALEPDAIPEPQRQRISGAALDVLGSALESALPASPPAVAQRSSRLEFVKTFIQRHLGDADLDVATIARGVHMSDRTLVRLFAAEGTTPMRWLWAERLRGSGEALATGRFARVTDAALAHGFKDLSHFSRAFKAFHGQTPLQALRSRG